MGSRAELRKVAELGLAESRGQLRRWSRHLDRGLQVGWSLAKGQPVGNRPCSGLPCSFIGAAVWLAAPPPSRPGHGGLATPAPSAHPSASRTRRALPARPTYSYHPAKGKSGRWAESGPRGGPDSRSFGGPLWACISQQSALKSPLPWLLGTPDWPRAGLTPRVSVEEC